MQFQAFFEAKSSTLSYVVYDSATGDAIIIDPVLNFDATSRVISKDSIVEITSFVERNNLTVHYILDTHVHADHISGAVELKEHLASSPTGKNARSAVSKRIENVFQNLGAFFFLNEADHPRQVYDLLLNDNEKYTAGSLQFEVIATPGHTPACASFLIGKHLFTGDALFMPDFGTGRCDFPGGNAHTLFDTISRKIYALPADTIVHPGHDYQPGGRELRYSTTIEESRTANIHLRHDTSEEAFVSFRSERDKTLKLPALILPSLHANLRGGKIPDIGPFCKGLLLPITQQ